MAVQELIGVYHADGGLVGELRYVIGHALGRTQCGLCDVTHSPVRRKPQWDRWVASLGVPVRLYHLNEMPADVAAVVARVGSPVFLVRTDEGVEPLLEPQEIDAVAGSVDDFAAAVAARLPEAQDA